MSNGKGAASTRRYAEGYLQEQGWRLDAPALSIALFL
jgi:hypothetical protein